MTKTHTVASGTMPNSTFKTFELIDFIDALPSAFVRMQAAQSYAWRIDTLIVQTARNLYKAVRDQFLDGSATSAYAANEDMKDIAAAEAAFHEHGMANAGPLRTLHELLDLRMPAHELARDATRLVLDYKGNMRSYAIPEIETLFTATGNPQPKALAVVRMQKTAARRAAAVATGPDVATLTERLVDAKLERERIRLIGMAENVKQQAGAAITMFNIACAHRPTMLKDTVVFHEINRETQKVLIASCVQALNRAEDFATSDGNMAEAEFDDVSLTVFKATEDLNKVLRSPRLNDGIDGNTTVAEHTRSMSAMTRREPPPAKPLVPAAFGRDVRTSDDPIKVAAAEAKRLATAKRVRKQTAPKAKAAPITALATALIDAGVTPDTAG